MGRALNAQTTTPWPAAVLPGVVANLNVNHHWTVQIAAVAGWAAGGTTPPAWLTAASTDVTLDLDATRNPIAQLRARVVLDSHDLFASFNPSMIRHVRVLAGWAADQQQPLFHGYLTQVTRDNGAYQIEAQSVDALWAERPLWWEYQVPSSATSMASLSIATITDPITFTNVGTDTPTSSQLAEFRAQKCLATDSLDDFVRVCAATLGQTLRGIYRTFVPKTGPQYHALGPITSRTRLTLPAITNLQETKSVDSVIAAIAGTVTWTEDATSKSETSLVGETNLGPPWTDWQNPKPITLHARPKTSPNSGVFNPAAYLFRQYLRPTGIPRYTFTTRAIWWLDPDQGLTIPTPTGNADVNIERIQYQVDTGTMTITANAA